MVLYNPGSGPADVTVNFADFAPARQWGASTKLNVRDLWKHASAGSATGSYTAKQVPSHGSVFVTLAVASE